MEISNRHSIELIECPLGQIKSLLNGDIRGISGGMENRTKKNLWGDGAFSKGYNSHVKKHVASTLPQKSVFGQRMSVGQTKSLLNGDIRGIAGGSNVNL